MSEPNGNTLSSGFGKDPLATSHGDALLDQNFQSLKSKEVRDSMSPTHELKFHSMSLTQPNTTGWDVQTSSEVSPDGRAYRTETLAKTDGVEKLNGGGVAEFKGRNEQRSSASHQGDDKNFVKQAAESSNTHLQEKVVFGDENNGRTEMKVSSTTSSSTSKFVSSSSSTREVNDEEPRYLLDSQQHQQHQQQREMREREEKRVREEQRVQEQRFQEQRVQEQRFQEQRHQREQREREERYSESREQSNSTRNVETKQHYEENKRYVDMDKASPEYQRHVQHLMAQPGEIISNTVEYPKPNVKMITTVKRLPDGTIVKNKRYETEQMSAPATESVTRQTQNQTQQSNQRRTQDVHHQQQTNRDVVDNAEPVRRPVETTEELSKQESYSTVKKSSSSRRYSTETTSETVEQQYDEPSNAGSPARPVKQTSNPIQEFPNQRPLTPKQPSNDFSTHGFPSVRGNKPTQEFLGQRPTTEDEEYIVSHKSQTSSRNVKQSSTSQRTIETEYVDDHHPPLPQPTPSWEQPASPRRPVADDLRSSPAKSTDAEWINSRKSTHSERIIETQVEQEPEQARRQQQPLHSQAPPSPRRAHDYSTHGFPSARSPTRHAAPRSPLAKSPPRKPAAGQRTPGRSTATETTTTSTVTRRQLQKEREVDAAHRAFAASLRSSSPAESTGSTGSQHHNHPRRDSGHSDHHQRMTPRSSVSSSRTYRRDGREGSHDSHAPSESSRISSTTVTRPAMTTKSVGKTLVTKQTVVKSQRNVQGSNETIDLMPQRSPKSPAHTATKTTTTTTTTTIGNKPAAAPAETPSPVTPTTPTPSAPSAPRSVPASPTSTETPNVSAAASPKSRPHAPRPNSEAPPNRTPSSSHRKPKHSTVGPNDDDEPNPSARRSSKSPSVERRHLQRETTFETRLEREFLPEDVAMIDDQIFIDESNLEFEQRHPKVHDKPKNMKHSPERIPAEFPSKPKESPRQSPEKQLPSKPRESPRAGSPEKLPASLPRESPRSTSPEKQAPWEPTRQIPKKQHPAEIPSACPDKQFPSVPARQSPEGHPAGVSSACTDKQPTRQSPEGQHPAGIPSACPDKQTPWEPTRHIPERQHPAGVSSACPDKQVPRVPARQSPERQHPAGVPSACPDKQAPREPIRQSPEKYHPAGVPSACPDKQFPSVPARQSPERHPAGVPSACPDKQVPWESTRPSLEKRHPAEVPSACPDKQTPWEPTRHIPERQHPAEVPSACPDKQVPRVPARQSPERQHPAGVPSACPDKQAPREPIRQSPEKYHPAGVSSACPDKQLPSSRPQESPRSSPEKEIPASVSKESPRQSPEKQLPATAPKDLPKESSPERQLPSSPTKPKDDQPSHFREDALFRSTITQRVTNTTKNLNEEFITNESQPQPRPCKPQDQLDKQPEISETQFPKSSGPDDKDMIDKAPETSETPDGGFISKSPEPEDQKPTFRKKGLTRRETFEDRCRKILGMEEDGDTQGNYTPKTDEDTDDDTEETETTTHVKETETFEFKIEDCLDDDEDDKTQTRVTKTFITRTQPVIKVEEPLSEPELSVDVQETEEIETFVSTEKTIGKKPREEPLPTTSSRPKDEVETLSAEEKTKPLNKTARWPKDEEVPRPATPRQRPDYSPQRPEPSKHPKEDAEFINVENETKTVTTQRTSKTPATKSPSPTRKGTVPYPESDEEPKRVEEPLPTEFTETIKVNEETTIVITQRPSKSPSPTRKGSTPCPKDEPEPVKQTRPTTGRPAKDKPAPRPGTNGLPKDGKEPSSQAPNNHPKDDAEYITEETTVVITKRPSKSPSPSPTRKEPETKHFVTEKIIDCNGKTVVEKISKTQRTIGAPSGPKKKQPIDSEPEDKQPESKKPSSSKIETERRNSRTTKTSTTKQPVKEPQPQKSPRKESVPKREPAKRDSLVEETRTTTTTTTTRNTTQRDRKTNETSTSPTIKDRLRSSPRKQKAQPDDIDGQSTSPDTSPTRIPSERRRSSNISVTTEIIIDHKTPKTPSPKTERKVTPAKAPISPIRKLPVTERKESAPVPRVTSRDKDKVTRSTSENVIKVVNGKPKSMTPEMSTLNPNSAQRPTERSRPSKCFTTKTINLSEQLINSEDMENVIIDIQQAKSSREPSPDRIVPTPVHATLDTDTGKPRYPDVVQEPDDEPRKKPVITNIPIFEEEANAYVGCQISELRNPNGIEADIHDNPMVEAPQSLDYSTNTPSTVQPGIDVDECLLSVHEKVSKFTHTAEQVTKPKSSTPFSRQFDEHAKVSASDECLLSIDQKVDRFLKTAENITKQPLTTPTREIERPNFEDIDEELRTDDCILSVSQKVHKFIDTAEKLAPTAPQKSPRLVANMERHISRQSELELEQESEPEQPSDLETTEEPLSNDELLPMTKNHTTAIELKRQKDILNRPSVFGQRKPAPTGGKSSTTLITEERKSHRNQQTSNVSPSPRSPVRKPSLEQPRSKPTDTERNSTTSTTSKRREHITQQQWVICDDVDVEEHSGPVSPQPTGPSKRTTSTTIKSTTGSTASPRKPSLELPRGKPSSDYQMETVTRRTTSTTKHRSDVEVDVDETQPMSPGRRSPTKPTTRSNTAPRKPSLEQPRNKPANKEPSDSPTETVTRRTTTSSTTTTDVDAPKHSPSGSPQAHRRIPNSDSTPTINNSSSTTTNSKSTVVKASTEHSTTKHTTTMTNRSHSPLTNPILASSPDTEQPHVEPLLERSRPTTTTKQPSPGRTVATRRNIFEKQSQSQSPSPSPSPHPTTTEPQTSGRRPSYMDHTKSSLEHIRRDSLEFNKTHYSRKSSIEDAETEPRNPNAAVKFDVPRRSSRHNETVVRTTSVSEDTDIDIESIFELATLEQLLETVTSYELRRRIRAQMRLIKKNMINAGVSTTTISSTTIRSSSSTPSRSPLPPRREQPQPQSQRERSQSPRTTSTTTTTGKPPVKPRERSASPAQTRRRSPTGKSNITTTTTTTTRTTNSSASNGQSIPERRPSKGGSGKASPIWADRTKVLRTTGSASPTPRKGSTTSGKTTRSSNITSTSTTSSSSNSTTSNKRREEDSITSSYGVGPTDENGLPLFGIRALKKKTQPQMPCETKQEVTGYVIEEQFYSDDKSPPRHERKELIYSSNPDELVSLSQQLERKSLKTDANTKLQRELKLIDVQGKLPDALDAAATTTSTRRGSVKELSERFIRKESTASNSSSTHMQSQADEEETEDSESNDVCSVIEMEAPQMRQQSSSSTTRTSSSTRSFLNTSGEERIVSGVDDVLERMRNADNVVEPGDSSEDREARALLNKFLGASVIMQGVETMLPVGQRQQQQQQPQQSHRVSSSSSTTNNNNTNSNSSSSNQAVKTTRISSSSSSYSSSSNKAANNSSNTGNSSISSNTKKITSSAPVTRTTCDIEEIWDEQLLRQLLEQASTYEERRKIRARLRELMAEREAQHKQQSSTTSERTETKSKDGGAVVTTTTTKVTTRTVSGNAATKNISPLAKFKQLDKAAAQQQAQKTSK